MKKKFEKIDSYHKTLREKRYAVSDDLYENKISSKTAKRKKNKFDKKIQKIEKYTKKLEKQHPTIKKENEFKK